MSDSIPAAAVSLGSRTVGPGQPCLIVAEVAQAHDGSLGAAHAFIDVAADAGACAIKFQTHIASAESTLAEPWRVKFSHQDATRYDYWKRMEFPFEQWVGLADHAKERGLIFLSSAFSFEAIDWLDRLEMPAWKVASGEVDNVPLLRRMADTKKPVLLSSGMSAFADLDRAAGLVRSRGAPLGVFQCTTSYPTPPEKVGLNVLAELRERYACPVGLSDHSATIFAGLAAATLGANMLEVHIALSPAAFGPDTSSSLTPAQLAELVRGVRFVETAQAHPVDKNAAAEGMGTLRRTFGKSVVAASDLEQGTILTADHLALKKPGHGLPPSRYDGLIGRTLARSVARDEPIQESDVE